MGITLSRALRTNCVFRRTARSVATSKCTRLCMVFETEPPWCSISFLSSPCLTPVADSANVQPSKVQDGDPPEKKFPRARGDSASSELDGPPSEKSGGSVLPYPEYGSKVKVGLFSTSNRTLRLDARPLRADNAGDGGTAVAAAEVVGAAGAAGCCSSPRLQKQAVRPHCEHATAPPCPSSPKEIFLNPAIGRCHFFPLLPPIALLRSRAEKQSTWSIATRACVCENS